jgi:hypothetical protein
MQNFDKRYGAKDSGQLFYTFKVKGDNNSRKASTFEHESILSTIYYL